MPSGVLNVGAEVVRSKGTWTATRGAFHRAGACSTASFMSSRRLFIQPGPWARLDVSPEILILCKKTANAGSCSAATP
jgi:hypothetical protein